MMNKMNLGKYVEKLLHVMSKGIQNAFSMSVAVRIAIRSECVGLPVVQPDSSRVPRDANIFILQLNFHCVSLKLNLCLS